MRTHANYGGLMGRLAQEEFEEAAVAADTTAAEAPLGEAAEGVEAELIEINNDVAEVAEVDAEIDDAVIVVDELETAVESLRTICANGGLDRHGATILNLHLESLYNRVGFDAAHKTTLSVESYGGVKSKVDATQLSMENIKENAKKLWDSIVTMIQKGIQFLKELFNKIFDGATKLKARAEAIAKRAADTKGEAKAKTFQNDKVAAALHEGGQIGNVVASAKKLADTSKTVSTTGVDASIRGAEALVAALSSGDLGKLKDAAKAAPITGAAVEANVVGLKSPGEGMKLTRGDALPGNRALVGITPVADDAKPESYAKIGVKLAQFDSGKKAPTGAELPVLSTSDAKTVATAVIDIANNVLSFKSKMAAIEKVKKDILNEAKKQSNVTAEAPKEGEAGPGTAGKMSGADARALARGAAAMVDQPAAAFMPYQLNTGTALLNYVELSLKQYQAAAAPAEKAAA